MRRPLARFAILAGMLAALLPLLSVPAAAQNATTPSASAGVAIPNLWDPNRRLDKPPTTSLTGIRFTTTDDFPPYNFKGPDGRLTGFNVDLAPYPTIRAINARCLALPEFDAARPEKQPGAA